MNICRYIRTSHDLSMMNQDAPILVEILVGVDGPMAGEPVHRGVQPILDPPGFHLRIGPSGRQQTGIQTIEEEPATVETAAVSAVPAHVHYHILGGIERFDRISDHIGGFAHVVDYLSRLVAHHVTRLCTDDRVRQDQIVGAPQQPLVNGRLPEGTMASGSGIGSQIGRLRISFEGRTCGRNIGVHSFGEDHNHTVSYLDIESLGVIAAVGTQDLDALGIDIQMPSVVGIRHAQPPDRIGGVFTAGVQTDSINSPVTHKEHLAVDADARIMRADIAL